MAAPRQREYYAIGQETTWGTGVAAATGIPFDSYNVAQANTTSVRNKHTGAIDTINVDVTSQLLRGSAEAEVHPDDATNLLKTIPGIPRTTVEGKAQWIPSFSVRFYDAAVDKYYRHLGIMCDQLRISAAGLDGELRASLDLIGKNEEEVSSFTQPSMADQSSFQMKHLGTTGFTIATVSEPNMESFDVTVPNNLRPGERPDSNGRIGWLDAGVRGDIAVSCVIRSHTDWAQDYHALVRGANTGVEFKWVFNYPGTGSPVDSVTITIPLVVLQSPARTGGVRDMQTLNLTGIAKKSASSDAITIVNA